MRGQLLYRCSWGDQLCQGNITCAYGITNYFSGVRSCTYTNYYNETVLQCGTINKLASAINVVCSVTTNSPPSTCVPLFPSSSPAPISSISSNPPTTTSKTPTAIPSSSEPLQSVPDHTLSFNTIVEVRVPIGVAVCAAVGVLLFYRLRHRPLLGEQQSDDFDNREMNNGIKSEQKIAQSALGDIDRRPKPGDDSERPTFGVAHEFDGYANLSCATELHGSAEVSRVEPGKWTSTSADQDWA